MTEKPLAPSRQLRQHGFTLLELLIAMSLLGLIFAALTGGLRFGTQAWRVGAERLADGEDLQLVHRTLRRQLSSVLNAPGTDGSARREGAFEGKRDSLNFVATAPARSMVPGLYHITLGLLPDAQNYALSLGWRRLGQEPLENGREGIEPLLRGTQAVEFSYFGDPDGTGSPRWVDRWRQDFATLPRLVRVEVRLADPMRTPWPAMVLTVGAESG